MCQRNHGRAGGRDRDWRLPPVLLRTVRVIRQECGIRQMDFPKERIVFRRKACGIVGVTVPARLTQGKIPEKSAREPEEFFGYLMRKYAL